MIPLRWTFGNRVQVAYSTAADGDMRQAGPRTAFIRRTAGARPCVVPRQVHGVRVADARDPRLGDADGVVSGDPRLVLGAYGADCPGLVLAAADALAVGHCGWRGTAGGMVARLIEALAAKSQHPPAAWHAFVGPGIGGDRYEVDAPVLNARVWPAAAIHPTRDGHAQLDLAVVLDADLRAQGLRHIHHAAVCTAKDGRLHSFRYHGPGQVQILIAWRS